ncbi:hypothetical protein EAO71_35140 [Streptomyces sp. ms191]|uniref:hypothetical protein n=1 Tax=Streptomyces sp. ms191 TaxID=1827978 RepID=UPI0011CDB530|nr:hypothetical protein [Streptomyces sp. ms191]TXS16063.1 hypothetical protein EAO71_35140 [Streptomyces sp. ms191]
MTDQPRLGPIDHANTAQQARQTTQAGGRHTVDSITSDALDQLYAELEQLRLDQAGTDHVSAAWARKLREQQHRAEQAEAKLAAAREATDSVHRAMVHDPRDWGQYKRDAWTYGVIVGWGCEERHDHDDICGADDALKEITTRHRWLPEDVARLKTYRAAIAALDPQEPQP